MNTLKIQLQKGVKTYSTHKRAQKFGMCRNPSPVTMPNGATRWVARPFNLAGGVSPIYVLGD